MSKRDIRGDTPSMDSDDGLEIEVIEHPFKFEAYANEQKLTEQIVEAINRMSSAGESAEEDYQACLGQLSRKANRVCQIVQAEYFDMPEDAYYQFLHTYFGVD